MTVVLGVIGSLLASTAALAQESDSPSATAEAVVFDVGVDSDITSLNPFNLCCGPDYEVMNLMYDLAIGFDNSTLEAAPAIVESWEHSEDYMDWTMNVREGGDVQRRHAVDRRGRGVHVRVHHRQRDAVLQGLLPPSPRRTRS